MKKLTVLLIALVVMSGLFAQQTIRLPLGEKSIELQYDSLFIIGFYGELTTIYYKNGEFSFATEGEYITFYVDLGQKNAYSRYRIRYFFETSEFKAVDFSICEHGQITSRAGLVFEKTDKGLILKE